MILIQIFCDSEGYQQEKEKSGLERWIYMLDTEIERLKDANRLG
jgi:hypothetical protein